MHTVKLFHLAQYWNNLKSKTAKTRYFCFLKLDFPFGTSCVCKQPDPTSSKSVFQAEIADSSSKFLHPQFDRRNDFKISSFRGNLEYVFIENEVLLLQFSNF